MEEIEKITGANCRAVLHALKEERLEKHARMLGLLKALGAEPEAGQAASESGKDDYPLISAAGNGDAERAAGLIKDGADVNGTDGAGCTALIASVYGGNLGIAEMLLDNGADISLRDGDGNTALSVALIKRDAEAVGLLMGYGAEIGGDDEIYRLVGYGIDTSSMMIDLFEGMAEKSYAALDEALSADLEQTVSVLAENGFLTEE